MNLRLTSYPGKCRFLIGMKIGICFSAHAFFLSPTYLRKPFAEPCLLTVIQLACGKAA